nr:hypothetical protein CFP56_37211 [Quercus suber]
MAVYAPQARALYRRFLRELPSRTPSILANPSPIQMQIRSDIAATSSSSSSTSSAIAPSLRIQLAKAPEQRLAEAEQYVHYLRAQRQYITLVERYNPGMNMDEEERVRLSARRVGINLPVEFDAGKDSGAIFEDRGRTAAPPATADRAEIRSDIAATSSSSSSTSSAIAPSLRIQLAKAPEQRLAEAEQYVHYLRAQRQYITLVERYNPGMNMDEEERVRLSARRVGINLPVEFDAGKDSGAIFEDRGRTAAPPATADRAGRASLIHRRRTRLASHAWFWRTCFLFSTTLKCSTSRTRGLEKLGGFSGAGRTCCLVGDETLKGHGRGIASHLKCLITAYMKHDRSFHGNVDGLDANVEHRIVYRISYPQAALSLLSSFLHAIIAHLTATPSSS